MFTDAEYSSNKANTFLHGLTKRGSGWQTAVLLTCIFIILTRSPVGVTTGQAANFTLIADKVEAKGETAVSTHSSSTLFPTTPIAKLLPTNGTTANEFGTSVAIDGNMLVVGATDDSLGSYPGVGSAYLFEYSEEEWVQIAKLTADDGTAMDKFGQTVAISGETVVIGAPYDDDHGSASGSVYIFEKGDGWHDGNLNQTAKLTASDAAENDYFGETIAISGNVLVIGTPNDDDNGSSSGSAYIFEKGVEWQDGNINQTAKLISSDAVAKDYFGNAVAIDGNSVIIGAYGDDDHGLSSGSVYVFEKSSDWSDGSINQTAKLIAHDGAKEDYFGRAIGINGDMLIIGASGDNDNGAASGAAYIFEKQMGWHNGSVNQTAKLTANDGAASDLFGFAVAVNNNTILIGAPGNDDNGSYSGSIYIFDKGVGWSDGSSNQLANLLPNDSTEDDSIGNRVAFNGEIVVAGVPRRRTGAAYLFTKGSQWVDGSSKQTSILLPDAGFGNAGSRFGVGMAICGDTIAIGAPGDEENGLSAGAVYLFERGSEWRSGSVNQIAKLMSTDAAPNAFGWTVACNADTVAVGAQFDDVNGHWSGAVYIFEKGMGWQDGSVNQVAKLFPDDGRAHDNLGWSLAIQGDVVIASAPYDDIGASGSVYIFEKGAGWQDGNSNQIAKLRASDEVVNNHFGGELAISGETLVIAGRDELGIKSIYVFEKGSGWLNGAGNQIAKLTNNDTSVNELLGALAIYGNTIVAGAPNYDIVTASAAYIFEKGDGWTTGSANQVAKLVGNDGYAADLFGIAVAMSGDSVVIGTWDDHGSAYVFEKGDGWRDGSVNQTAELVSNDVGADSFGLGVAIHEHTVVVNAYLDDDNGTDSGSAYVFDLLTKNKIFLPTIIKN